MGTYTALQRCRVSGSTTLVPTGRERRSRSFRKPMRVTKPDYVLVLPWHFKDGILRRKARSLASGGRRIIAFPEIGIV